MQYIESAIHKRYFSALFLPLVQFACSQQQQTTALNSLPFLTRVVVKVNDWVQNLLQYHPVVSFKTATMEKSSTSRFE